MKSITEYINEAKTSSVMSGFEISPYDNGKNNWRDCLTDAAFQIYMTVESDSDCYKIVEALIKSLLKKDKESLSAQKLAESSVLEKVCSMGVKELKRAGYEGSVNAADRKQFKEFFAKKIIDIELDEYSK